MRRAFLCAVMLLACLGQAATIETTCEWIDTGEACNAPNPGEDTSYLQHAVEPNMIWARLGIGGYVYDPSLSLEEQYGTRVSFRYQDTLTFSFTVRGGEGQGVIRIGDTFEQVEGFEYGGDPDVSLHVDTNWPIGDGFLIDPIPFTYGEPITYSMNVDYSFTARGFLKNAYMRSFSLQAPEGAYFEETMAHNPEPSTFALIVCGIAGLLYRQRQRSRR